MLIFTELNILSRVCTKETLPHISKIASNPNTIKANGIGGYFVVFILRRALYRSDLSAL